MPTTHTTTTRAHLRRALGCAVAAVAMFGASTAVRADDVIKTGMFGCISEDLLNEALGYAAKRDNASLRPLFASGQCVILRAGARVSVVDAGFMVATLRYQGVKVYAPSEVLR